MKIYIQSPVFQKIVFNSNQTNRKRTILQQSVQTPQSRSLNIRYQILDVRRKSNAPAVEQRGLSLTIARETNKTFFRESKQHTQPDNQWQIYLREIQEGNLSSVIPKLESAEANKKNSLLLGIAYKNNNQLDKGKIQLLKTIREYPNYIDAYIQLCSIELKLNRYQEALGLIEKALSLSPNDKIVLLSKAKCHSLLKQYKLALETYEKIKDQDFVCRLRYSLMMIKCGQLDSAQQKIDQLLLQDSENSEALLTKGIIQFKRGQINDCILSLEQSIQLTTGTSITAKAISYIVKAKICQKDFYGAQLNLRRGEQLNRQFKCLGKLQNFVNGTVLLMKRSFKQGLDLLLEQKRNSKFIVSIQNQYLAYAHFCNSDYSSALNIYKKIANPDLVIQYNKILCEGLIQYNQAQYSSAMEQFDQACRLLPNKIEPYFYKAATVVQDKSLQSLQECQRFVDEAFKRQGKQPNLFYARALVKSLNRRFTSALKDIDKAIDKSEDTLPEHFYLRGLLHSQSMRLKEAIKDFSTCIHFNKDHADSYLQRSKCYQIKGESTYCFNDLSKFMKLCRNTKQSFYWSGSLLFHNNAYEEAIQSFEETDQTEEVRLYQLKCYLKMQRIENAIEIADKLPEKYFGDQIIMKFIKNIIDLSNKSNQDKTNINIEFLDQIRENYGEIFKKQDYQLQKAAGLLYLKQVNESIQIFQDLEVYWQQYQKERLKSISSHRDYDSLQSEEVQNEMVLKAERIIQHIIGVKYNLMIIYLMIKKYKLAQQMMVDIREQVGNVHSDELEYLSKIIHNQIDKKMEKIETFPKILTFLLNEKSIFNYFPTLRVTFNDNFFDCKLSLNFPDIQPPNICPQFDQSDILKIRAQLIENKPEAPWLNRNSKLELVFTEKLIDQELNFTSDDEEQQKKNKDEPNNRPKKKQINLKLDDQVQRKLERLMKQQ